MSFLSWLIPVFCCGGRFGDPAYHTEGLAEILVGNHALRDSLFLYGFCEHIFRGYDISDPNYVRYAGWELPNFIFHDIRMPVIWLLIGLAVYFTSKSKWKIQILAAIAVLMVILMILWVVTWQPPCCIYLVR